MDDKTVTFQDGELKGWLRNRGESTSVIARRDLKRYYTLLKRCLGTLHLSENEAALICEALKDYQLEDNIEQIGVMWGKIDDAIGLNQLDSKWQVNGQALVRKFQSLTPCQIFAVIDAVEQFWFEGESNLKEELHEKLIRVGLTDECCASAL
ncbi:hypothetical protein [Chroococcidiopsis sp. CCMEE 29]|uniref:hypothetical protein n=1 Tax=Chroococcidiopsis sp. CCMEE 29 TaxID=155894 RepID=UPI00202137C0|nr:hypothetical protein [Chroococcidiopsis sp. CCMEE 29]